MWSRGCGRRSNGLSTIAQGTAQAMRVVRRAGSSLTAGAVNSATMRCRIASTDARTPEFASQAMPPFQSARASVHNKPEARELAGGLFVEVLDDRLLSAST